MADEETVVHSGRKYKSKLRSILLVRYVEPKLVKAAIG